MTVQALTERTRLAEDNVAGTTAGEILPVATRIDKTTTPDGTTRYTGHHPHQHHADRCRTATAANDERSACHAELAVTRGPAVNVYSRARHSYSAGRKRSLTAGSFPVRRRGGDLV
jgi:hypothetical protein